MSYTPKNNFNLKMIETGVDPPVYSPENNSNLQLKRTDAGEVGFRKKLWKTVLNTCNDPEYYFRWVPLYDSFYRNTSNEVSVAGGVGDFSWSIEGSGFSLANATTSGRTNTVNTDGTVETNDSAVVTVVDSCGASVSGNLRVCYSFYPGECCGTASIGYTTQQMLVGHNQDLSVENSVIGYTYNWEITSGGGELSSATGTSTNYTAPDTNVNCDENPIISLSVREFLCDILAIAVTHQLNVEAYTVMQEMTVISNPGGCDGCRIKEYAYDCIGDYRNISLECSAGPWNPGCPYPNPCDIYPCSTEPWYYPPPGTITDKRTEENIAAGCCPAALL